MVRPQQHPPPFTYPPESCRKCCTTENFRVVPRMTAPALQEENLTSQRGVRVQPSIRPIDASLNAHPHDQHTHTLCAQVDHNTALLPGQLPTWGALHWLIPRQRSPISSNAQFTTNGAFPEFQRGFVWKPKQVCDLIKSLWLDYPVGTLLVWDASSPVETRSATDTQARCFGLSMDSNGRLRSASLVVASLTGGARRGTRPCAATISASTSMPRRLPTS